MTIYILEKRVVESNKKNGGVRVDRNDGVNVISCGKFQHLEHMGNLVTSTPSVSKSHPNHTLPS